MDDLFLPAGHKPCKGCGAVKPLDQFDRQRLNRDGLHTSCKTCRSRYEAERYAANTERIKARVQAAYAANPEPAKAREARRYQAKKPLLDAQHKAWRKANWDALRPLFVAKRYERDAHIARATPPWADLDMIRDIYRQCDALTRQTGIKHNVDHVVPLRGKNVCGLHVHYNLQILTERANKSKGASHVEYPECRNGW